MRQGSADDEEDWADFDCGKLTASLFWKHSICLLEATADTCTDLAETIAANAVGSMERSDSITEAFGWIQLPALSRVHLAVGSRQVAVTHSYCTLIILPLSLLYSYYTAAHISLSHVSQSHMSRSH